MRDRERVFYDENGNEVSAAEVIEDLCDGAGVVPNQRISTLSKAYDEFGEDEYDDD